MNFCYGLYIRSYASCFGRVVRDIEIFVKMRRRRSKGWIEKNGMLVDVLFFRLVWSLKVCFLIRFDFLEKVGFLVEFGFSLVYFCVRLWLFIFALDVVVKFLF